MPEIVGGRSDVTELRWAFHRVARIKREGWHRPAKDAGTCWVLPDDPKAEPREEERVESTYKDRSCTSEHHAEVISVFAVDREPVKQGSSDEHPFRPQRERLDDIQTAAKAAVSKHR